MEHSKGLIILLLILAAIVNSSLSTIVKPCKTGVALTDDKVSISECDKEPCSLKRGKNVSLVMYFTAAKQIDKLHNSVFAFAMGMKTPYPGVDGKNACDFIYSAADNGKSECPLQSGTEYYYNYTIQVKKAYPKINALLHWAIKEKGATEDVACFEVDVNIV